MIRAHSRRVVMLAGFIVAFVVLLLPVLLIRLRKRWVAAFNLAVTNRITRPFAARLPGFGIVTHIGRKSGRVYRTPVNVFRTQKGVMIALTYGPGAHWVQNLLAAGGGRLEMRGTCYQVSAPSVVHDPTRRRFPFPVRIVLRIIGATDFLHLSATRAAASSGS